MKEEPRASDLGYYELRLDYVPWAECRAAYGLAIALMLKLFYRPLSRLFSVVDKIYVRVPETGADVSIEETDIPEAHRERLVAAAAEFAPDGFTQAACFTLRDTVPAPRDYSMSLLNPDRTICLTISSSLQSDDVPRDLRHAFSSIRGGARMATDNGPANSSVRDDVDRQRFPDATARQLYQKHRERMKLSGWEAQTVDGLTSRVLENLQIAYRDLITRRIIRPASPERIAAVRSSPPRIPLADRVDAKLAQVDAKLAKTEARIAKPAPSDGELVMYYYSFTPFALAAFNMAFAQPGPVDSAGELFAGIVVGIWALFSLALFGILALGMMTRFLGRYNPESDCQPTQSNGRMTLRTKIILGFFGTLLWAINIVEAWFWSPS